MKFKKASIFIKIVILALIVYASVTLTSVKGRIETAEADRAALQTKLDIAMREKAELEYDIEHAGDPEIIAEIARTKLGLVMPGEKIFYDVSN
ncbi:MAG: septum formation initiator family protein [Oscillospiraceae bacterium]|nr:septum formation initiator family protein [Oscillospiraceae bacterium]